MRAGRTLAALLLGICLAPAAEAAPMFLASPPSIDRETGEMVLYVGGIADDGTTLKPSTIEVEIDGEPGPSPKATEVFSEHAQTAAEASQAWKSPLAVGLVYLWVKEVPAGTADAILEGVSGLFRRIPARTNVYATLYGRKRQPIPKLKASEIGGQLHDIGFLPGDRPNLADAIRVDLKALLGDEAPFKVMVVVTDGRDYTDTSGDTSADFTSVADEVDKADVKMMVVSFPPPEADAEHSTKNLVDLAMSGAARRSTEQPLEVQTALEALGQAIADMRRVRVELPWAWRHLGGTHKVRLNLTIDGKRRALEVGKVTVAAQMRWLLIPIGIVIGLLLVAAGVVVYLRRRGQGGDAAEDDMDAVVAAAHGLIQRGLSAPRALVELTRSYPDDVSRLADLDDSVFYDERYPLFKTRAGRRRFEELQLLLSHKSTDDSLLGNDLAEILSQCIAGQSAPDQVASSIAARVPEDQWGAFSRMGLDELAKALRASGSRYPALASPRARGLALEIQAALRNESQASAKASLSVGWLVRAAGQGKRGETLRLPPGRAVLGSAPGCDLRLDDDTQIAQQHATISERRGSFYVEPVQGTLKVETKPANGRVPLGDGDTIEMGQSRFVFKCVSSGNVAQSRSGA